ncbi:PREDICTED: uncharacterized protein LOC105824024 [Propithecus coquereli]|uniref:uncharacterized protein LOC105824024 n=1 Tax=Propithecus coquereli TaxID=379532 RepID=UPI00063FC81E|nr:PREDICTED: uncharacterized protein LOC105824024 [Propithecus coquereli]
MEHGEVASAGPGLSQAAQPPRGALTACPNPHAALTVVVEVELGKGSGPEETGSPTLLLEGPTNVCLLQPGTQETQEAEQELLARVQSALGSVGRGYSVALLLRGRETEAPRLVPQLLQALFEEALPLGRSDHVLSTLSLVQLGPSGRTRDLLSPAVENLSVLDVPPLGLVVEDASEVEVSDSRAASELYLQATGSDGRDCPLLQVLAGEVAGEEVEGSLPWIISWLLEGNNYSGLLLHLDPQGISLSLLQAALLGASGRRMEVKQVRPTLWDAVEEARARRAGLRTLRLSLLEDTLTDNGLSRLGRALRELQVVKAWSQCPRSQVLKEARAEGLPEPQAQQVPDMALQFFLAQARRQRLRVQHQIWIREKLKHLEQEEVAGDQVKGLEEACEERQRWHQEQTVLRLQLEALEAERDAAEQDLEVLYDLHVQATRARTCHMLQVFRAWQRLWKEQAMTTEHHHRRRLAGVLQDTINLATQNQELQAQNQQLWQGADYAGAVLLDPCPGEKSGDQEAFRGSFLSPHS